MASITIVGLGPGKLEQLTLEAWRLLENADEVHLRTTRHPLVDKLPQQTHYHSFDDLYDEADDFESLYQTITQRILELGQRPQGVIYAVPGHPLVGERTTSLISEAAQAEDVPVRIVEGLSFIEPTLTALGIDGMDGLQIHDALEISAAFHPPINPDQPALIAQVYSRAVASHLKLTLMNQYPDEYDVILVHEAGTDDAQVERCKLYEIDRSSHIAHLTSLYIPPFSEAVSFESLMNVMARLRSPTGCPWDQEQSHASLRPYMLEELYEVLEAIDNNDVDALVEELGDMLLHITFHAQIAVDEGEFYMTDVIAKIIEKMIRRHPHIWGDTEVTSSRDVEQNWEAIKRAEYAKNGGNGQTKRESALDGIPMSLPALIRAYRLQEKAASVGFDWPAIDGVIDKIREEIDEIEAANSDEQAHEFGDLLFAIVNWVRWQGFDPEGLLREANMRFYHRFNYIENEATAQQKSLLDMTLEEMDALWDAAKNAGL